MESHRRIAPLPKPISPFSWRVTCSPNPALNVRIPGMNFAVISLHLNSPTSLESYHQELSRGQVLCFQAAQPYEKAFNCHLMNYGVVFSANIHYAMDWPKFCQTIFGDTKIIVVTPQTPQTLGIGQQALTSRNSPAPFLASNSAAFFPQAPINLLEPSDTLKSENLTCEETLPPSPIMIEIQEEKKSIEDPSSHQKPYC